MVFCNKEMSIQEMGNLVDVGKILKMLGKKYLFKGCKVTHVTQVLTHY